MLLILQNIAGWLMAHKRLVAYAVLALIVLIAVVVLYRSCKNPPPPRLNEAEMETAKQVIANNDHKELENFKANVAANIAKIDKDVDNARAAAVNAAVESRKDSATKTNEELAAEIEQMVRDSK